MEGERDRDTGRHEVKQKIKLTGEEVMKRREEEIIK